MLTIRFFRIGKKNQPSYKIVVTDKRNAPSGGLFKEEVGFYNPITKEKSLKGERIKHWISKGAQPSDTAYNLFVKEGIIEGKKVSVLKKSKKKKETPAEAPKEEVKPETSKEEPKTEEIAPVEEKPKEETPKQEVPVEEAKSEAPKEEPKTEETSPVEEKPKEEVDKKE